MTEPPRHKRFQIHLSTAILLMFVVGALIWANVIDRRLDTSWRNAQGYPRKDPELYNGWPLDVLRQFSDSRVNLLHAAIDIVIGFILLAAIWLICEWLIRRSTMKKGA
jgi:hypothetical protein